MQLAVTNEQMRAAEENAGKNGISAMKLMKNAGEASYSNISRILGGVGDKNFVILAGRGNNGGDGIVIADLLTENGASAILVFVQDLPKSETARQCYSTYEKVVKSCIYVHRQDAVKRAIESCDAVIDCVFGTGFHGQLEDNLKELFSFVDENCPGVKISIDVPSGIDSDTGEIADCAFKPDHTVVLAAMKKGLYSHPAFESCGKITLADIGIARSFYDSCEAVLSDEVLREFLPARPAVSHKGTFGKLLNISGSAFYTGAALLSTNAALRMGVGLCTLATPARVINAIAPAVPETTYLPLEQDFDGFIDDKAVDMLMIELENKKYDALLMGCGLGDRKATADLTEIVIRSADCPVILDADGLNAAAQNINVLKESRQSVIVTPHPAEFSRMTGRSVPEIQRDRIAAAKSFAKEYNCIVVLKGVNTVVAAPGGETFVNTTGNAGLAKGGSGDVLAGMIASLAAQGVQPLYAAAVGVYLHGLAADTLAAKRGMAGILPRDIPEILPDVIK
ncbi:MAG: NAD(P)H-hydrate dehydratase [Ruminiclostridium sp.]|nr:NAD(P)H-hydrate dehydratase [Ruminiclostridium sp.]